MRPSAPFSLQLSPQLLQLCSLVGHDLVSAQLDFSQLRGEVVDLFITQPLCSSKLRLGLSVMFPCCLFDLLNNLFMFGLGGCFNGSKVCIRPQLKYTHNMVMSSVRMNSSLSETSLKHALLSELHLTPFPLKHGLSLQHLLMRMQCAVHGLANLTSLLTQHSMHSVEDL